MGGQSASRSARIIVALVRAWLRARFHVEVHGFEHFSCSPSTLVVSNHRRDADGPIIGTMLLVRDSNPIEYVHNQLRSLGPPWSVVTGGER